MTITAGRAVVSTRQMEALMSRATPSSSGAQR